MGRFSFKMGLHKIFKEHFYLDSSDIDHKIWKKLLHFFETNESGRFFQKGEWEKTGIALFYGHRTSTIEDWSCLSKWRKKEVCRIKAGHNGLVFSQNYMSFHKIFKEHFYLVQILWEGHKIWKNLPHFFEIT